MRLEIFPDEVAAIGITAGFILTFAGALVSSAFAGHYLSRRPSENILLDAAKVAEKGRQRESKKRLRRINRRSR